MAKEYNPWTGFLEDTAAKAQDAEPTTTIDKAIRNCDGRKVSVEHNPPYTVTIEKFEYSVYEKTKRTEPVKHIERGKETINKTVKLNGKTLNDALEEAYKIVGAMYTQKTKEIVSKYKNRTKNGGIALCNIYAIVRDAEGDFARGARGGFGYSTQEKWTN